VDLDGEEENEGPLAPPPRRASLSSPSGGHDDPRPLWLGQARSARRASWPSEATKAAEKAEMAEREEEGADDGVGAGSNPPALRSCKVGSFLLLTTLFFTLFISFPLSNACSFAKPPPLVSLSPFPPHIS